MADEAASSQLDATCPVHRDRRSIVQLTSVTEDQGRVTVEEEAKPPPDANVPTDVDPAMNHAEPPCPRSHAGMPEALA
jgi:hypothetical protein